MMELMRYNEATREIIEMLITDEVVKELILEETKINKEYFQDWLQHYCDFEWRELSAIEVFIEKYCEDLLF